MQNARVGATISVEGRGPPWIVAHHDRSSVLVGSWPGRLWRVRIAEVATERDQRAVGGPPLPYARYTRCISVHVEGEEDVAGLFGKLGAGVVRVLNEACQLSRDHAETLAGNRHTDAAAAQDRVWRSWLQSQHVADDHYEQLDGTLYIGGERGGSPVGRGLIALATTVFERAKAIDGDAAIDADDKDTWLVHPWDGADDALRDAALALGASEMISAKDHAILLNSWSKVFGR